MIVGTNSCALGGYGINISNSEGTKVALNLYKGEFTHYVMSSILLFKEINVIAFVISLLFC